MNLSLGLKTTAKRFPNLPAIEWEEGSLTYSEFECQVSELAYSLQHYHRLPKGTKIGDRRRIQGQGYNGGSLDVEFILEEPEELTKQQQLAIKKLRDSGL